MEMISRRTGIAERDVERVIAESEERSPDLEVSDNDRAIRVLEGWHRDPGYVGIYGLANELSSAEFKVLCDRYAAGRPVEHILGVLEDADCVRVTEDQDTREKRIRCVNRTFVSKPSTIPQIERMGKVVASFVATIDNNVHGLSSPRLEKRVWPANGLKKRYLEEFDEVVRERTDEYLLSIDNWLSSYHSNESDGEEQDDLVQTGVGVFHYVEAEEDTRSFRDVLEEAGLTGKELHK